MRTFSLRGLVEHLNRNLANTSSIADHANIAHLDVKLSPYLWDKHAMKNTVCLIQECLAWSYFRFLKVISHLGEHRLSALVHLTPNSLILPFLSVFFFLQKSQIIFVVDKTLVTYSTKIPVTLGCFSLERPNNGDSHFHFRFPVPSSPPGCLLFYPPVSRPPFTIDSIWKFKNGTNSQSIYS